MKVPPGRDPELCSPFGSPEKPEAAQIGPPAGSSQDFLAKLLEEGVVSGDALHLLPQLPRGSVDLFFTSPPYADARAYSRIHPDRYVEWLRQQRLQ